MDHKLEIVTPAKAEAWLNSNNLNRNLRPGVVERYADDMLHGRWTQCIVPIAFYTGGDLADGQHRLFAIIESGTSQSFVIMRGLKREDGLNIDTGLNRTIVDNGRISGADPNLSNTLVAVCRGIADGNSGAGERSSNAAKIEMVAAHREAAEWAVHHAPHGRGLRNAILLAAIGRAWYYEGDKDRLVLFCTIVNSGFTTSESESAAIALRNYFLTKTDLTSKGKWRDTFLKAQNAINYFMRGKKLTVVKSISDECYPLKPHHKTNVKVKPWKKAWHTVARSQ